MIPNEFIKKAKECTTKEEVLELAKSENIEIDEAEINALFASGANKELSDEELENVTGGLTCYSDGVTNPKTGITREYVIVSALNNCPLNSLSETLDKMCGPCDDSFSDGSLYCSKRWRGHDTAVKEDGFLKFVDD